MESTEMIAEEPRKIGVRRTAGDQKPLLCPRCVSFTMHERVRGGVAIDVCQTCGGIWLDPGEIERLVAHRSNGGDDAEVIDPWSFARRVAVSRGDYDDG
ncbi:zf-TFIIB domain-containing protein [Myxococcota bacterium]|nr:zf-TFIIB domain-containing protein [Myxococcota bacterium]